jgi:hypothetical protein
MVTTVALVGFVLVMLSLHFETICRWVRMEAPREKKMICIDFDGVLHDNITSVWKNARTIDGNAIKGSIEWLMRLVITKPSCCDIAIFSSRNAAFGGIYAMKRWLYLYGMPDDMIDQIKFPIYKEPQHVIIDDRAMEFTGKYPDITTIITFKPWNKRKDA